MNVNDVSISQVKVEFFPYLNRVPLKFGHEVSNGGELVCVRMQVTDTKGRSAWGYGETPLGAAWSWPSVLSQSRRVERMQAFCLLLQAEWGKVSLSGHPMEIGSLFLETRLTDCLKRKMQHIRRKSLCLICVRWYAVRLLIWRCTMLTGSFTG